MRKLVMTTILCSGLSVLFSVNPSMAVKNLVSDESMDLPPPKMSSKLIKNPLSDESMTVHQRKKLIKQATKKFRLTRKNYRINAKWSDKILYFAYLKWLGIGEGELIDGDPCCAGPNVPPLCGC